MNCNWPKNGAFRCAALRKQPTRPSLLLGGSHHKSRALWRSHWNNDNESWRKASEKPTQLIGQPALWRSWFIHWQQVVEQTRQSLLTSPKKTYNLKWLVPTSVIISGALSMRIFHLRRNYWSRRPGARYELQQFRPASIRVHCVPVFLCTSIITDGSSSVGEISKKMSICKLAAPGGGY